MQDEVQKARCTCMLQAAWRVFDGQFKAGVWPDVVISGVWAPPAGQTWSMRSCNDTVSSCSLDGLMDGPRVI